MEVTTDTTAPESAPEAKETALETTPSPTSEGAQEAQAEPKAAEPAPFVPTLKYKVHDKEHEMDPLFKDLVKSADHEKKLRELHEKSHGIEHIKQDRATLREENLTLKSDVQRANEIFSSVNQVLQKKDFDSLFEALKVSEDDVLKWAVKVAERRQNPQLNQQWSQERQYQQQLADLQRQNQTLQVSQEQIAAQAKEFELNSVFQRPDVQQVVTAFDARVGRPGAFREEVIKRGQLHWVTSKTEVSAEQAVNEVLALAGLGQPQTPTQTPPQVFGQPAQAQHTGAQGHVAPERKPVIPNIQGRGTSPAAKVPRNLDDLRKLARSSQGA